MLARILPIPFEVEGGEEVFYKSLKEPNLVGASPTGVFQKEIHGDENEN